MSLNIIQKSNVMLLFLFLTSSLISAQIVTAGSETKINTTTANSQQNAKVAMDNDGNYLVVWESERQDGSGFGVYGQWYDADGTTNGSEFQVNTTTQNDQRFPAVAVTEDGRSSIVWVEDEEDGSGWTLKGSIYDNTHAVVASGFSIRTSAFGQQRWPDVAMDDDGNSYYTWTQVANNGAEFFIYTHARNASGTSIFAAGFVNDATSSFNGYSKIAVEENGDFAVTWQIFGSDNATTHGILCERFNASGVSQGVDFQVNTEDAEHQISPDIAMDSVGNFTVVWTSADQDGDGDGIYGQRYTSAGVADGSEFQVSTTTTGFQNHASIGMSKEGSATVAWNSYGTDGSFDGVYMQAYDADGASNGSETLINTTTASFQQFADVAGYSISNDMTVVWSSGLRNSTATQDGSSYGVYAQRFGITPPFSVAVNPTPVNCNGESSGSASVTISNGTSPFTYAWSTAATSSSISGLAAGTYTVTVTQSGGGTATASGIITEPALLTASVAIDDNVSCNGFTDGGATASATGGANSQQYSGIGRINKGSSGNYFAFADGMQFNVVTNAVRIDSVTVYPNGTGDVVIRITTSTGTVLHTKTTAITGATGAAVRIPVEYTVSPGTGYKMDAVGTTTGAAQISLVRSTSGSSFPSTTPDTDASLSITGNINGFPDFWYFFYDWKVTVAAHQYSWSTGASSSSISSISAGTYTVTITDNNGCTDTETVTITEPTALVASTSNDGNVSCNGGSDGGATASATGGTGTYTYAWSNAVTTASITGVGAATYTVTITDANGCTDTETVTITEPTALSASTAVDNNVSCGGLTDGGATASATGGTGTYTYAWSTSTSSATIATTASITGVTAATYTVTITDANGCTDTETAIITEPATLVAATTVDNNVTINGGSNGGATASATGGTGTYTYAWSNAVTTPAITGVTAATYTVTITDANGCTDTETTTITEPTVLVAAAVVDNNVSCNGGSDGGATASATGGVGTYTYAWSTSTSSATIATTASITGVVAGTYTVTITDNNGATATAQVTITQPSALVASISNDGNVSCNGFTDGGATASATGGTGTYTYAWSNAATTGSITGVGAATYTVTITDANGCTDTEIVTITEPTTLSASTVVDNNVSCGGFTDGGATASATGGTGIYTYAWSNAATTASITGVVASTYTVTITDANGCTDTETAIITEPATLIAATTVDNNVTINGGSNGGATASGTGGTGAYTYAWSNGATTAGITGVTAATYTVTITDANGCTDTETATITEPTVLVAAAVVDNNVSCNGGSDGGATASATGGVGTYTYAWSTSTSSATIATTASITGVVAGTYTVTVTDNNGATATDQATITEPVILIASTVVDNNVSCNGFTDGGATASATGGTGTYTYAWSNAATTASITGVVAATYTVTITDANGCTDTETVTITEPTTLSASTAVDNNVSCGGLSDGGATASGTGGTGTYTYAWSNAATTASITGVGAATYTVTITDANGCTDTETAVITEPATLVAATTVDNNVTINGGSNGGVTASATGGTGVYTYAWSNSATTAAITGVTAATYTVTITDANGCTDTETATITEPTPLAAMVVIDSNVSCNNLSNGGATASATGGVGTYTYAWSTSTSSATIATTASITGVVAGTYTVTITDNNGATATDQATITEPTTLVASISNDGNVSCNGFTDGGATASATGGTGTYTYAWSNAATTASITGVVAATYTVTITDANGCTDTETVTITEPTTLSASTVVDNNVSCGGLTDGGATASATGGTGIYTYAWSNAATTASITGVVAATYTVTITDANGCTDTETAVITGPTTLIAATVIDSNVTVNGGLDGGATASATGGTGVYTYAWSNAATTASITGVAAGTYTVTITDANGCTDTETATITEPTPLVAMVVIDSNVSCNNFSNGGATASATGGVGTYTYAWSTLTSSATIATTASITGVVAGTYTVTITDNNGATATDQATITEPTTLVASISNDGNVSCNGFTDGGATASATGGTGTYTYAWSNAATTVSITGVLAATYTVTITDANGCTDTETVTITEPTTLSASTVVDNNVSCEGLTDGGATASATGGTGIYTYAWSTSTSSATIATTASITGVGAGSYSVTITDSNGCTDTGSTTITEPVTLIAATVIDSNVTVNGGLDGGATASATGGTGVYTYAWSNATTTASITGVAAGTYTVTITDANGCTDTETATITEPTPLAAMVVIDSNVSCNNLSNGGATASATGGAGTYTYAWSTSTSSATIATTASITGVVAGTYTVTVTDNNGATATDQATITEPVILIASTVVDNNVSCNGLTDGGATASGTGGTSPYIYAWSNAATTASIAGVDAGTYSVTITDNNGCTDTSSVTITEPTALVASTVVDSNVTCNGLIDGGATSSTSGGTSPYTYAWSNAATTASIAGVGAGSYSVTITDNNGCTDTSSVTITEPTTLVASTVVDSNVTCNGLIDGGATSSISGGTSPYTYAWSNAATTVSITGVGAGTYSVTITDNNGCTDSSSVIISEPVLLSTTDTITACETYTWTQTGLSYIVTGLYMDTISSVTGCDSILILDLTINQATSSTVITTSCGDYTWLQSGLTYTVTGMFNDTILNTVGCDSIVTLDLTINQPSSSVIVEIACGAYTWPQNNVTYTSTGMYNDTIPNTVGCDSIITLDLTIRSLSSSTVTEIACETYTWPQNGITYTVTGVYNDTIPNGAGCDSIVSLSLTIDTINLLATKDRFTLTANQAGASYQWLDCLNGDTAITGATSQSYLAIKDGDYSVIVTFKSCSDTSACYTVIGVGIDEIEPRFIFKAFPNPTRDDVTIQSLTKTPIVEVRVRSLTGQLVSVFTENLGNEFTIPLIGDKGIYLLEVEGKGGEIKILKVIKQ